MENLKSNIIIFDDQELSITITLLSLEHIGFVMLLGDSNDVGEPQTAEMRPSN